MKKICLNCNNEIKNARSKSKFCSNDCQLEFQYKTYIQKWKDGEVNGLKGNSISNHIRKYMLEKNNCGCEMCGCNWVNPKSGKSILEIHHIDGDYTNNNEDNLQVLCPNHHAMTENFKNNNNLGRKKRQENNN